MKTFIYSLVFFTLTLTSCAQEKDTIIGVWDVKNDYYEAIYEVVAHEGKYHGKVHYYNDGKDEYKGKDRKKDYFLTDVEYLNGEYVNGKMYGMDGTYYEVIFTIKDKNTLEAKMTVQGEPYKETWTRNTSF